MCLMDKKTLSSIHMSRIAPSSTTSFKLSYSSAQGHPGEGTESKQQPQPSFQKHREPLTWNPTLLWRAGQQSPILGLLFFLIIVIGKLRGKACPIQANSLLSLHVPRGGQRRAVVALCAARWAWYLSSDRRCQEEIRRLPIPQEHSSLLAVAFLTPLHHSIALVCGKTHSHIPSEQFKTSLWTLMRPHSQVLAAMAHWSHPSAQGSHHEQHQPC